MFPLLLNIFSCEGYNKPERPERKKIPDDNDLVARIKKGDISAFKELVERHRKRAFFTALGMVGDPELAHDLTQDAWVAAFSAMPGFKLGKPFYPWFYRILMNLCKNALRHREVENRVVPFNLDDDSMPEIPGDVLEPDSMVEDRETKAAIWWAIEQLPPEQREVIILAHFENRSYIEIAEIVGIPKGTVMSRLYYARRKLAQLLDEVLSIDDE
ncbi:hypothetical protein DRQ36_03630 [bacterium]|nr:MAG: hypothetical protein DRQ36_03630 [bacterium]